MRHIHTSITLLAVLLAALPSAGAAPDSPYKPGPNRYPRFEAKSAEHGVTYGRRDDLPLPKTILYSVSPDELLADAEEWSKRGFSGFFVTGVAPEWSSDIWATDGEPWTIGSSDKTLQKVKQANAQCRRLGADTFLTMAFSHTFDWFDDIAWQKIEDNFRQFARFARASGCRGLAVDIEYVWPQYHFVWEGYTYDGYTRRDLVAKVRQRAAQMARAMYDAFPDAPLLTFPESGMAFGLWIQSAWIEEAARRDAPGGVHLCTEYTYRRPNLRYMLGHAWMNSALLHRVLSPRAWAYWRSRCSIAEGLWPFGEDSEDYHGVPPSVDEFRQAFAASLMVGSRYNWIYTHDARPAMLGRKPYATPIAGGMDAYMRVIADRQVVTDARYLRVARDLRSLTLRDYVPDLGLTIVPTLAGPREELEVGLMPVSIYAPSPNAPMRDTLWNVGTRILAGEAVDLHREFSTNTHWLLIGPFANAAKRGYDTVYPPETGFDPADAYDGVGGRVRWTEYRGAAGQFSVNLARVFKPTEEVCAYAQCWARVSKPCEAEIRVGANDTWKLWVGGRNAFQNPDEGRIILDRDVVPVSLPAGTTPILLKVCNNRKDWGFVFRITAPGGKPLPGLELVTHP